MREPSKRCQGRLHNPLVIALMLSSPKGSLAQVPSSPTSREIFVVPLCSAMNRIASLEVVAGRIFWLPSRENCDESLLDDRELHRGYFDRPVLVLTADHNLQMAVVLLVN